MNWPDPVPVIGGNGGTSYYLQAFVNFNSYNEIGIFYDYPFGHSSAESSSEDGAVSLSYKIQL